MVDIDKFYDELLLRVIILRLKETLWLECLSGKPSGLHAQGESVYNRVWMAV